MTNMKKTSHNRIPKFKNRQEVAKFWDTHSVSDYLDELKPVTIKFDLEKPQEETVVFRLHTGVKKYLEKTARRKGLNLSSLIRMWIMEKVPTAIS